MAHTPAPTGLRAAGKKLWKSLADGTYEFRPDELRILTDACRTADAIAVMEKELDAGELTVKGSQGQPVANPMLAEIRQYRALLVRQLKELHLPDEDGRAAASRSESARSAANARWRRGA